MTTWVLLAIIAVLLAINIFLWKSGFLQDAENPKIVNDNPVKDPKERKAFLKRLWRWKEEGRLSREEYEHLNALAEENWD